MECRICLNISDCLFTDLFSGNEPIYRLLEDVTGLEIKESKKLPSNICDICKNELDIVCKFKKKCEDSEFTLQKRLKDIQNEELQINVDDESCDKIDDAHFSDFHDKCKTKTDLIKTDNIKKAKHSKKRKSECILKSLEIIDEKENKNKNDTEKKLTSNEDYCNDRYKNRKYMCAMCGKTFIFHGNLVDHERVHSGDKPFECTICNQRFAQSGHLMVHERIHSGFKPYQCDICAKFFTVSHSLKKHMRTHTGEKPYTCIVCNKPFSTSYHLSNHFKMHKKLHNTVPSL